MMINGYTLVQDAVCKLQMHVEQYQLEAVGLPDLLHNF